MSKREYNREEAREKVKEAQAKLQDAVETLMTSEGWEAYLRSQARFHKYSFGNTLLIHSQCPGAQAVKGFKGWQGLGRQVRKGEKGIRILAPAPWTKTEEDENGEEVTRGGMSFRVVSVFDVSQTDPIPGAKTVYDPDAASPFSGREKEGDQAEAIRLFDIVKVWCQNAGRKVLVQEDYEGLAAVARGCYTPKTDTIWVKPSKNYVQMFSTMVHEAAHALTFKEVNDKEGYNVGEVCAEAVAFIVLDFFGFEAVVPSSEYVARYMRDDSAGFKKCLTAIQKTAHEVIEVLAGAASPAVEVAA